MKKEKTGRTRLKAWGIVLLALADDAGILALILLGLWFFGVRLTMPVLVVIALVFGVFIFIVHRAVFFSLHARKTTGREGMIGMTCEVAEMLKPDGVVHIAGEYWKAKSLDGTVAVGREVEVVAMNGLALEVKKVNADVK